MIQTLLIKGGLGSGKTFLINNILSLFNKDEILRNETSNLKYIEKSIRGNDKIKIVVIDEISSFNYIIDVIELLNNRNINLICSTTNIYPTKLDMLIYNIRFHELNPGYRQ